MVSYSQQYVIFLFTAAGNTGSPYSLESPGTCKNCLTVGASLNDWDSFVAADSSTKKWSGASNLQASNMASFSSLGPTADNRLKPDVLAPGALVFSAACASGSQVTWTTEMHCSVEAKMGTSQATPLAAGAAVLVRQYFTDGYYPSGEKQDTDSFVPSGALLKAVLVHSGQRVDYSIDVTKGTKMSVLSYPSTSQGYGRIQLDSVLNFDVAASTNPISLFVMGAASSSSSRYASITATGSGQGNYYQFTVPSDSSSLHSVRVTMAYSDIAGTVGISGSVLVNDLDVIVYEGAVTSSTVTTGLTKFEPYRVSAAPTENTVEVIDIAVSKLTAGRTYTVVVFANALSSAEQSYALVVTGDVNAAPTVTVESTDDSTTEMNAQYHVIIGVLGAVALLLVFVLIGIYDAKRKKASEAAASAAGGYELATPRATTANSRK